MSARERWRAWRTERRRRRHTIRPCPGSGCPDVDPATSTGTLYWACTCGWSRSVNGRYQALRHAAETGGQVVAL